MFQIKNVLTYLFIFLWVSACGGGGGASGDAAPEKISVTITVDKLPNVVNYNRAVTPDGYVEFGWGVTFDINGDGAINQGDIGLRLLHFKAPSSSETTGPLSDFSARLWIFTTDTRLESVAAATQTITGNSITLSIDRSAHASLASISNTTLVYFLTTNRDDSNGLPIYDYYPGFATLIDIPLDKQFTDVQGDVVPPESDMVSMSLNF